MNKRWLKMVFWALCLLIGTGRGAVEAQVQHDRIVSRGGVTLSQTVVTFSATPTFDVAISGYFKITLTGNVTSSTISNAVTGKQIIVEVCQDATGGRAFVWPTNTSGAPGVSATASTCTAGAFGYNGATWVSTGGGLSDPILSPNPTRFDVDVRFKGPNPWLDVTRFGARGATPFQTTATMGAASTTATLAAASNFQNGDGVVIYGAGATNTMSTPAAPRPAWPRWGLLRSQFPRLREPITSSRSQLQPTITLWSRPSSIWNSPPTQVSAATTKLSLRQLLQPSPTSR